MIEREYGIPRNNIACNLNSLNVLQGMNLLSQNGQKNKKSQSLSYQITEATSMLCSWIYISMLSSIYLWTYPQI